MKPTALLLAGLLCGGLAQAGDVYVTRDAQGNVIYTDTPQTIPAQKLGIHSANTDPAAVQARADEQTKRAAENETARTQAAAATADASKAQALKAEDRARRCVAARERYQAVNGTFRIYEEGPDGERRYLTSEEIDAARAESRRMMDEFCGAD